MVLTLSENCQLGVTVQPSGIPDHKTVTLSMMYPLAQHPRWQPLAQVTLTDAQRQQIADAIKQ